MTKSLNRQIIEELQEKIEKYFAFKNMNAGIAMTVKILCKEEPLKCEDFGVLMFSQGTLLRETDLMSTIAAFFDILEPKNMPLMLTILNEMQHSNPIERNMHVQMLANYEYKKNM